MLAVQNKIMKFQTPISQKLVVAFDWSLSHNHVSKVGKIKHYS